MLMLTARHAKCVERSKRVRFDVDRDENRGRKFDFASKHLPDGLSKVDRRVFLSAAEQRPQSQIQGRSGAARSERIGAALADHAVASA